MKKTIYLKSIFLLCLLLAGAVNAHADDYNYDYECVKVTDLSEVTDGETVLLVGKGLALSNSGTYGLRGVEITIGEDNVIENVPANIMWTIEKTSDNSFMLKNNGNYLWGSRTTPSVSVSNTPTDFTYEFMLDSYGADGGYLYYVGNEGNAYFCWRSSDDNLISISENTSDRFTLYKITVKNYVKWKKVSNDVIPIDGEEIVVVDLNTESAMSNDKADKDPDAVAVTLNDDKDRILGDVAEKVQWTFKIPSDGNTTGPRFQFMKTDSNDYLYADSKGLKVGNESDKDRDFTKTSINDVWYLKTTTGEKDYLAGVEESMFSNSWKLKELKDGQPDDKVKNTRFAFFQKVDDPQKVVNIELAEYYNYDMNEGYAFEAYDFEDKVTITGAAISDIKWYSSNPAVATITEQGGFLTLVGRGTTVITAIVREEGNHDKASAKCTVIVDDSSTADLGTLALPLTVDEAKQLAETGKVEHDGTVYLTWEEGVNYYVKGKVSKVNSGLMAMFGDMDFGEMMGGSGSGGMDFDDMMDDMDFDMDSMDDMGFDMSSLGFDMSSLFGSSDKVTYYISDDGTKDNQMKVVNGCGTVKVNGFDGMEFNEIPKLSPGDCVVVCGPVVYTEDTSMFSGMMGGGDENEPKKSAKVDEMNYLAVYDPTLLVEDKEIYVNKTLDGSVSAPLAGNSLYSIDNSIEKIYNTYDSEVKINNEMEVQAPTYKSSDEEIAKWDEDNKMIVGVNEGTAKITVKVKVIVVKDDPTTEDTNEEKSYTMKRKFKLTVKTRDLEPAGYYNGEWVLTTSAADLYEGTRLVLVGTRVKEGKEDTDYMMVENNAMMGGGKNGSKIEFDDSNKETIPSSTVISKGGLEVVLEQAEGGWYLNVGEDEKGNKLYLYASEKKKEEGEGEGNGEGGFNFDGIMEMFNPSSGLKVATMETATADSCKATISFDGNIATIKFPKVTDEKNNTIMLSSAFDMDSMMEMFGGMGGNNEEEENPDEPTEEESTFDMGSFDMFMASFNTKKPGDENPQTGEDGETKAPKCFMPRIYRFVPDETFDITIGATEWRTIVTYKDVEVPENVEAYIVTNVTPDGTRYKANLKEIKNKQLKGGEPYLLHYTSPADSYTMTLLTPYVPDELEAPNNNKLKKSDRSTTGTKTSSNVYVLANKSLGVGFYRWTGDELGAGRVYLPIEGTAVIGGGSAKAFDFCNFLIETAIDNIKKPESDVKQYYNLNGQRVTKPSQKGVYIVNGKTVVVK